MQGADCEAGVILTDGTLGGHTYESLAPFPSFVPRSRPAGAMLTSMSDPRTAFVAASFVWRSGFPWRLDVFGHE